MLVRQSSSKPVSIPGRNFDDRQGVYSIRFLFIMENHKNTRRLWQVRSMQKPYFSKLMTAGLTITSVGLISRLSIRWPFVEPESGAFGYGKGASNVHLTVV